VKGKFVVGKPQKPREKKREENGHKKKELRRSSLGTIWNENVKKKKRRREWRQEKEKGDRGSKTKGE